MCIWVLLFKRCSFTIFTEVILVGHYCSPVRLIMHQVACNKNTRLRWRARMRAGNKAAVISYPEKCCRTWREKQRSFLSKKTIQVTLVGRWKVVSLSRFWPQSQPHLASRNVQFGHKSSGLGSFSGEGKEGWNCLQTTRISCSPPEEHPSGVCRLCLGCFLRGTEHPPQLTETGTTDGKNQSILIVFLSITSHLLALW